MYPPRLVIGFHMYAWVDPILLDGTRLRGFIPGITSFIKTIIFCYIKLKIKEKLNATKFYIFFTIFLFLMRKRKRHTDDLEGKQ